MVVALAAILCPREDVCWRISISVPASAHLSIVASPGDMGMQEHGKLVQQPEDDRGCRRDAGMILDGLNES